MACCRLALILVALVAFDVVHSDDVSKSIDAARKAESTWQTAQQTTLDHIQRERGRKHEAWGVLLSAMGQTHQLAKDAWNAAFGVARKEGGDAVERVQKAEKEEEEKDKQLEQAARKVLMAKLKRDQVFSDSSATSKTSDTDSREEGNESSSEEKGEQERESKLVADEHGATFRAGRQLPQTMSMAEAEQKFAVTRNAHDLSLGGAAAIATAAPGLLFGTAAVVLFVLAGAHRTSEGGYAPLGTLDCEGTLDRVE